MSLKILNSKDLYNPFILPYYCQTLSRKHKENVYNAWKAFYFTRYQQKKREKKPQPTSYRQAGGGWGGGTLGVEWDEDTVKYLN